MLNATISRQPDIAALDPHSPRILLCGKSFVADHTGALYWPAENTLIAGDLQLSRCSYLDGDDVVLPPYDTVSAFEKLEDALDRYDPERVIALGDSFAGLPHEGLSAHRTDWLLDMMEGREWYWVTGSNHVPPPENAGGVVVPHMTLGGIKFRAEPLRAPVAHEIAAALHPVAQVSQYGHTVRGRCFVTNGDRLILPSVGNYSTGSNVLGDAFNPFLGHGGLFVWVIMDERVESVASALLIEDGPQTS